MRWIPTIRFALPGHCSVRPCRKRVGVFKQSLTLMSLMLVLNFSWAIADEPPAKEDQGELETVEVIDVEVIGVEVVDVEVVAAANPDALDPAKPGPPEFLKPYVNAELSFIKRVCRPTVAQMNKIVTEATKSYRGLADLINDEREGQAVMVMNGLARQNQPIRFVGPNQEQLSENPFVRIRNDAQAYLKPCVSDEQYQDYVDESKMRTDFERKAAIDIAIGYLEDRLALTEDQREKIFDTFMKSWDDIDIQWIQMYLHNPQFMPSIPTDLIRKILTAEQKQQWQKANKRNAFFQAYLHNQQNESLDEQWIP